jgi:hypothetical protein
MPRWSALTDHLLSSGLSSRLTWDELADIVGELPPSASNHRAWWSGDRTQVRAWKDAGFRLAAVSLGRDVTFVREVSQTPMPATPPTIDFKVQVAGQLEIETPPPTSANIVLLSCSKTKAVHPAPARDLYDSALFRQSRAYAEASGGQWFILSAEHGLVGPDEWLAPYERYLPHTPASFRDAWGHWVVERLALVVGDLSGGTVEIHAGAAYVAPIADRLRTKGCDLSLPLDGLSLGARQHWYALRAAGAPAPASIDADPDTPKHHGQSAAVFTAILREEAKALPPAEFLARGSAGLKVPGLYSWWADEQAASDLTDGLGHTVAPGMIYAGLAGATRWPSGKRSSNTLWSRIAGMHLGKRHEFSTFRRTLGAVQAQRMRTTTVDEQALTHWMMAHLRVLAAPYEDADTLGRLESDVLRLLDPPLNLQGMPASPVRRRLTDLRRVVNHKAPSA